MNIVLFTNGSKHGVLIAKELIARGIAIRAVFVEKNTWKKRLRKLRRAIRQVGFTSATMLATKSLSRLFSIRRKFDFIQFYQDISANVTEVERFNSVETAYAISEMQCDVLVLAGAPIIQDRVLAIPRIGTINCHTGQLPKYRGNSVVEWAIYNNDPVIGSVHWVDQGVDTGDVIVQQEITLLPGDTLDTINNRLAIVLGSLLAEAILQLEAGGDLPRISQDLADGSLYFRMPHNKLQVVKQKLRDLDK